MSGALTRFLLLALVVAAAAIIGFLGNELVAVMQIRVGNKIGSATLIADGMHARTDGLTSLAVLVAARRAMGMARVAPTAIRWRR